MTEPSTVQLQKMPTKGDRGAPTEVTNEFLNLIKEQVLIGGCDKDICKRIINPSTNKPLAYGTWMSWKTRNYRNFDILLEGFRDAALVAKAELNFNDLLSSDDEKIRLDTSKFIATTLKKNKYSTRQELTGADNKPLFMPSEILNKNGINTSTEDNSEGSSQVQGS